MEPRSLSLEVPRLTTERGQQKLSSFRESSSQYKGIPVRSDFRPNLGVVNQVPLTSKQASALLDAAGFPSSLEKYRKQLIQEIVNESASLPPNERRTFDTLLKQASHVCSKETTDDVFSMMDRKLTNIMSDSSLTLEEKQNIASSWFKTPAKIFAQGDDLANWDHYLFNNKGKRIGVNRTNATRKPLCVSQIDRDLAQEAASKWKASPAEVGYGGRTRKQKKRSKKTLRRRKMRRNVH